MELCDLYILDQDYAKAAFCCEEVWQLVEDSLEFNSFRCCFTTHTTICTIRGKQRSDTLGVATSSLNW